MALTDAPLFTAQYYGDSGGATQYWYWIQVKYPTGDTMMFPCIPASVTVMSLSHNNVVSLNWTPMPGAVNYSVFRNTSATAPVPATNNVVGGTNTNLCIAANLATANGLVDNGLPVFTVVSPDSKTH